MQRVTSVKVLGLSLFVTLLSMPGCSPDTPKGVTNDLGKHSVSIPPEWAYVFQESATRVLMTSSLGIVNATVYITPYPTEYATLEESASNYFGQLKYEFTDYFFISDGQTQINGQPAHWHRLKDTEDNNRFETVLYIMQPAENELMIISCSAPDESFEEFENDFNKIAFSVEVLGR